MRPYRYLFDLTVNQDHGYNSTAINFSIAPYLSRFSSTSRHTNADSDNRVELDVEVITVLQKLT